MEGRGHPEVWERGDLYYYPGQLMVPLILSDSMLRDMARLPTAIKMLRGGATMQQLVVCAKAAVEALSVWQVKPVWVILVGGGNNIDSRYPHAEDGQRVFEEIKTSLEDLRDYLSSHGHYLTVSTIIPRPREMSSSSLNSLSLRKILVDTYLRVNEFIEGFNADNNATPLLLHKFLHYEAEMVLEKKRPKERKMYERKFQWRARMDMLTGMRKIRGGRFQRDGSCWSR